jgi:hypothetical protein
VRCAGPDADWELGDSHNDATGEARLVEALALAAEQTHAPRRPLVLGLHTASYGYLHTGQLSLSVDHPLQWRSGAQRRLTGTHNELLDEEAAGPYCHRSPWMTM